MRIIGPACAVAHGTPKLCSLIDCNVDVLYLPAGESWEVGTIKNTLSANKIDVYILDSHLINLDLVECYLRTSNNPPIML